MRVKTLFVGVYMLAATAGCGDDLGPYVPPAEDGPQVSLRFRHGEDPSAGDFGVYVPIAGTAANVGAGDFTIEMWLRSDGRLATSSWGGCRSGVAQGVAWLDGHVLVDRSESGVPNYFGLSLFGDAISFGIGDDAFTEVGVCEQAYIDDGEWHHLAAVRDSGSIRVYVDGTSHASIGGIGTNDVSYPGAAPDRSSLGGYLILGGRKHAGTYQPWQGWIDEVRISTVARYPALPAPTARFEPDAATAVLYHFDEPTGTTVMDSSADMVDGEIVDDLLGDYAIEYEQVSPFALPATEP
jgi:hypothetical protein